MSDHTKAPLISPTKNPFSPISSFLGSPRLFNGFLAKNLAPDTEATAMSPTSILDLKNSPSFVNPFGYDRGQLKLATPSQETSNSKKEGVVGLALIDSLIEEKGSEHDGSCFSRPLYRASLFGSRLKVQIPDMNDDNITSDSPPPCSQMSPKSPADFGIKTRNSYQFLSPVSVPGNHITREFSRQLSLKEMELSEDYTCVTTHGPNPKTTHIFDDCIVESFCGDDGTQNQNNEFFMDGGGDGVSPPDSDSPSPGFLSFCHTCKDVLAQDKDIYMYRGEKAFCSQECRCQEMFLERMENPDCDDAF